MPFISTSIHLEANKNQEKLDDLKVHFFRLTITFHITKFATQPLDAEDDHTYLVVVKIVKVDHQEFPMQGQKN